MKEHNQVREVLEKYNCPEYGDVIIDEICKIFNYPPTKE